MERITMTDPVGPARYGHEFRYRLAAGFIERNYWVLDAACGSGYGFNLLYELLGDQFWWLGVDNNLGDLSLNPGVAQNFATKEVDLTLPALLPATWDFEVFLGFETIEHLHDYGHYVNLAQRATKWILVSTPVIPTVGANPYHVHDFKPGDLREIFENVDWEHYQTIQQPSELAEITILRRRT